MRPSYSWSRSPKRPKALTREHGGVEGSRILGPSRARGTAVAAQSHTPGSRRAGVRCMSGRAPPHFCDIHDASHNKFTQLTRGTARHTATEIWTP
jgi:hypothetical protein